MSPRPVLVVEDDAGVRAFLVSVLVEQGYRGAYARVQGRVEHFQVLPKPVAAELLEHAVAAAV